MQFTTSFTPLSIGYAGGDVLEHTSHTAYTIDSFFISFSSVMHYVLIRPFIKGNAGPIASILERFYNPTVVQWRHSYIASDKLTIIKYAEVCGNRAAQRQFDSQRLSMMSPSPAVKLTTHTLTISTYPHPHLIYIKAILISTQRPPTMSCSPARHWPLCWPTQGEQ